MDAVSNVAPPLELEHTRLVAIMRRTEPVLACETVEALLAGGVRAVEVTFNSPGAVDMLRSIGAAFASRVLLGAGTVLDDRQAELALVGERERRLLTMLSFDLWDREREAEGLQARLHGLWQYPSIRDELLQLLSLLADQSASLGRDENLEPDIPLLAHQRYSRNEVLAAVGAATVKHPPSSREGVFNSEPYQADLFFITLQKTHGRFSPTTMYRDYAISSSLFHWESQSTMSAGSPTGQRYIHHATTGNRILSLRARDQQLRRSHVALPVPGAGILRRTSR